MAAGGRRSQRLIRQEIDELSRQIFEIDVKIQQFEQQKNTQHIPALKEARKKLQQEIVPLQIELELKKAQGKRRH